MDTILKLTIFTLSAGLSLGYFTFLLHDTEALAEYGRVLGLSNLLGLDKYRQWNEQRTEEYAYYPLYISLTKGGFWGHLFGCPFCSMTFLSMLLAIVVSAITLNVWALLVGSTVASIAGLVYIKTRLLYKKM